MGLSNWLEARIPGQGMQTAPTPLTGSRCPASGPESVARLGRCTRMRFLPLRLTSVLLGSDQCTVPCQASLTF
nr:MAG TPA: hypothetical protein [Caudoviricetes sp.]